MFIGYTMGTELQICAYLTARHAGMRHYGRIFGIMTSIIGIGGGLGTVTAAPYSTPSATTTRCC